MQSSIRFRPRPGHISSQPTTAVAVEAALDRWLCQVRASLPRCTVHLIVVSLVILAHLPLLYLPTRYDGLLSALSVRLPQAEAHVESAPISGGSSMQKGLTKTNTLPVQARVRWQAAFAGVEAASLLPAPVVHTIIPERPRREVILYTVQEGESLLDIATQFGLRPETVAWANGELERNPDLLRLGQQLTILPIDGVYHTVLQGDSLSAIARQYGVDVAEIVACPYNELDAGQALVPGQKLIVPGGTKPYIPRQVTAYKGPIPDDAMRGTGVFEWPTSGNITDRYGFRTYSGRWHTGVDIVASIGAPIYAADAGFVTYTGNSNLGYGKLLIVDHGNGYVTYYAHLSVIYVSMGQSVEKGSLVAAMGSTGNSTGPHLHFEIRHKGVPHDPQLNLP